MLEFFENGDGEDEETEDQAQDVYKNMSFPAPVLFPVPYKKPGHAEFGERESDEDLMAYMTTRCETEARV